MKKSILILLSGLGFLLTACEKDKKCINKPCKLNHTCNIYFAPPHPWLYQINLRDTDFNYIGGGYVNALQGVNENIFISELPRGIYNVSILAWYSNLTFPDSTYTFSEIYVEECDTFKINI